MDGGYSIPGVYYEPRPRAAPSPLGRTDVAGFVGFESRVRDGTTPCQLTGGPPAVGHRFQVDVTGFQAQLRGARISIPQATDLVLSASDTSIPIAPGGSIVYALVAVAAGPTASVAVVPGAPAPDPRARPPEDDAIAAAVGAPFTRVVDVRIRRDPTLDRVYPVIEPRLALTRLDDHREYELAFGPLGADDGTFLGRAARAYFANGGRRLWIATVRRPRFDDPEGLAAAAADMVGVPGSSEAEATGVERLLMVFEVAVVDLPDLYARRVDPDEITLPLPPRRLEACFRDCAEVVELDLASASGDRVAGEPLFDDATVLAAQRELIVRIAPERWRVLLLLAAPIELDPADGRFHGPSTPRVEAWRAALGSASTPPPVDDLEMACAALYHPWVLTQDRIGAVEIELPPTPFAAGVIARRDLQRGPHVAPAGETLHAALGLVHPVDDAAHARLYASPRHVNLLRAFPGEGVKLWGARTLSTDTWLRYLPVRRCLSAIERRMSAALQTLVFEPNTSLLWFQITQLALGVLLPIFQSGALRGDRSDQAFYVRCDESNNPRDQIEAGRVLCEVGVAIAAPAEFVVFRLGRREGLVEVLEAP